MSSDALVADQADQPGEEVSVTAAGAIPWRLNSVNKDQLEVLLIHRPRYDDWSWPKGKIDAGETIPECAVREVEEETGLRCSLGPELPSTDYTDPKGRPKRVRYWAMEVVGGELRYEHEVDAARWLSPLEATEALSYERDADVLRAALSL